MGAVGDGERRREADVARVRTDGSENAEEGLVHTFCTRVRNNSLRYRNLCARILLVHTIMRQEAKDISNARDYRPAKSHQMVINTHQKVFRIEMLRTYLTVMGSDYQC